MRVVGGGLGFATMMSATKYCAKAPGLACEVLSTSVFPAVSFVPILLDASDFLLMLPGMSLLSRESSLSVT